MIYVEGPVGGSSVIALLLL